MQHGKVLCMVVAEERSLQIYEPMLALESTAMITPCSKMKPNVVVPWLGFTYAITSDSKVSTWKTQADRAQQVNC